MTSCRGGIITNILVVDDDPAIRELLSAYLTSEGFAVSAVSGGDGMRKIMDQQMFDLVVLDLKFPTDDGLQLAAEIRARTDVNIIMLTQRTDVVDRVVGLEMGADDYLTKPFHLRELLARIRGLLRRSSSRKLEPQPAKPDAQKKEMMLFRGWQLDLVAHSLTAPNGQNVPITSGDFRLLEVFVKHPRQVLSRDRLLDLVTGRSLNDPFDRSIDTRIRRLRIKLCLDASQPEIIKTVRGEGYVFAAPVERLKLASRSEAVRSENAEKTIV